jgi:diacylglycerol kinase (ATP)
MPAAARPGVLIYNPKSGRRRHAGVLDQVLAALARGGWAVEPRPTSFAGEATQLAHEIALAGRVDAIFAFGGDGTVREVAAGLLGTRTALGILPGGTVNLMAHALGIPRNPVAAAELLAGLPPRPLDVGLAGSSPFLMMASAGLDARILAVVNQDFKWRFGRLAVVLHGLWEWWRYSYPELAVVADGERLAASFASVSNIPLYGGGFRLAPGAHPDDRQLDLVLFRGNGRFTTLSFIIDVLRAAHTRRKDVSIRTVRDVVFEVPEGSAAQVDGDLCEEPPPVHVRLSPTPLMVLAPPPPRRRPRPRRPPRPGHGAGKGAR